MRNIDILSPWHIFCEISCDETKIHLIYNMSWGLDGNSNPSLRVCEAEKEYS